MRTTLAVAAVLVLAGCSGKKPADGGGGAGSGTTASGSGSGPGSALLLPPTAIPAALKCPPGNAANGGACVAAVTPAQSRAVAAQQTRLAELSALLDRASVVAQPVEILDQLRALDSWKQARADVPQLELVDSAVATLASAVKQLGLFKATLAEAAAQLGNLKGLIDTTLASTGVAPSMDALRTQVSTQVRAALDPLAEQVAATIQGAIVPLVAEMQRASDALTVACAAMRLGGAGEQTKTLCLQATKAFAAGITYVDELKDRPGALYAAVSGSLETELGALLDEQTTKLLAASQASVNSALGVSTAAGSAAGSGSGTGAPRP